MFQSFPSSSASTKVRSTPRPNRVSVGKPAFVHRMHTSSRRLNMHDFTGPVRTHAEQLLFFDKYFTYTSARSPDWAGMTSAFNRDAIVHISQNLGNVDIVLKTEQHMKDFERQNLNLLRSHESSKATNVLQAAQSVGRACSQSVPAANVASVSHATSLSVPSSIVQSVSQPAVQATVLANSQHTEESTIAHSASSNVNVQSHSGPAQPSLQLQAMAASPASSLPANLQGNHATSDGFMAAAPQQPPDMQDLLSGPVSQASQPLQPGGPYMQAAAPKPIVPLPDGQRKCKFCANHHLQPVRTTDAHKNSCKYQKPAHYNNCPDCEKLHEAADANKRRRNERKSLGR